MEQQNLRNYEVWEGFNKFYWNGHIMTGPNPKAPILVFLGINLAGVLTFAFPMVWYAINGSPAIMVFGILVNLVVDIFLILTWLTDPGYLPGFKDDENDYSQVKKHNYMFHKAWFIKLKFCQTCKIIRPPRTTHWSEWNWCIERMDHHWPWLGWCIGKRNYTFFITFIVSLAFMAVYNFSISVAYWVDFTNWNKEHRVDHSGKAFGETMKKSPLVLILILAWFLIGTFVVLLWIYHLKLLYQGKTTHEDLKESTFIQHPFSYLSCLKNFRKGICHRRHKKKFNPRQRVGSPMTICKFIHVIV